jgi:hypothetical protein
MDDLIKSLSGEAAAGISALVAGTLVALGLAFKTLIEKVGARATRLAELRLEVEIARLEREKLDIAAAAGARIAEVATQPAAAVRGEQKKAIAIAQAADLLGVSSHAATPSDLPDAVQAAYERDEGRRSFSPDALTPAETPRAKREAERS